MRIHSWEIKELGDIREVSAGIDDFRLWYRLPKSYPVSRAGDPFVAAALLPAMAKGGRLEVDPSLFVSPRLLINLAKFQDIHHCWNPALKTVPIDAVTRPTASLKEGTLSFFSGGLDSMFTFLKRREEISHMVFIHGFDFIVDREVFRAALVRKESFAGDFGKTIIPVETNFNTFGYHHNLSLLLTQGSALASVALLLGFSRAYVSSAYSYSVLVPGGSHPLTDPLWSTEAVEVVHEGAEVRRVDKVIKIAENPSVLANLLVCADEVLYNCGKCEKCLRTMIPLQLIGVSTSAFPPLPPLSEIKKIRIRNEIEMLFFKENYDFALKAVNKSLRDALRMPLHRYERKQLFRDIDRIMTGGLVKRTYRKIVKSSPGTRRISMTPPKE